MGRAVHGDGGAPREPEGPRVVETGARGRADLKVGPYVDWADLKVGPYVDWADLKVGPYDPKSQIPNPKIPNRKPKSQIPEPGARSPKPPWGYGTRAATTGTCHTP